MRPTLVAVFVALSGILAFEVPTRAQEAPLVLEVAGGGALPTGPFADGTALGEGVDPGASLRVSFVLPRRGRPAIYAGFSQHRFGCHDAGCAAGGTFVATGFNLGIRLALLRGHRVTPWLGVGAVTTRVETGDLPAPNQGVSDLGFGGEAGAGLYVGWDRIALQPMVTWTMVDSDLPGGSTLGLRFLAAHLALAFPF